VNYEIFVLTPKYVTSYLELFSGPKLAFEYVYILNPDIHGIGDYVLHYFALPIELGPLI
jgi:hypothetical protein